MRAFERVQEIDFILTSESFLDCGGRVRAQIRYPLNKTLHKQSSTLPIYPGALRNLKQKRTRRNIGGLSLGEGEG